MPHFIRTKVFISYSHYDSAWLRRLHVHLRPLERDGIIERWDDTRIGAGKQWYSEITTALAEAKVAVLLISADFLASDFIVSEELPPLLHAAVNDGLVVLPVLVKPCRFKQTLVLSQIQAVNPALRPLSEMTESEQETLWVTLTNTIEAALSETRSAQPENTGQRISRGADKIIWNVPYERNSFFTGREERLLVLRESLNAHRIAAISGLGGIGKTQTAIEYAFRHQKEYRAILWIGAETEHALIAGYLGIAKALGLPESRESDLGRAVTAAKQWFATNEGWLLIFDNADTPSLLRTFRPVSDTGHVLITSRTQVLHSLGIASAVKLNELTLTEAVTFLRTRIGREMLEANEITAASEIASELGCLPLALEQAGAYIIANHCRLQDYLRGYRKRRLGVLPPPVAGEYPESVATTWAINFTEVETRPAAADLLRLSAYLAPDSIPLEFIAKAAGTLGPSLSEALNGIQDDPLLLDEALEPLTRYSLIHRDIATHTYSIHRIVQAVIRDRMDTATLRLWAERTVTALYTAFPTADFPNWPACERLIAHARAGVLLVMDENLCTSESCTMLHRVASYLWERAQYDDAEPIFQYTFTVQTKLFGLQHADTARTVDSLAALYYDQGHFAKAEPYYTEALSTRQQLLTAQHPEIASSVYALGRLCYRLGRYKEAQEHFENSLQMRQLLFGRKHPDVALSLYGLARLNYRQAWYGPSREMFEESLEIRQTILGAEHPECAMTLMGLGLLRYVQGHLGEAEAHFKRSLAIRTVTLGTDHPDIAGSLTGLALTYGAQHRYDEMQPIVEQAVRIREKVLGPTHLYTATPLYALGALHQARRNFDEAEKLFERVLNIRESALGVDHPSVAACLKDLALLYCEQVRFDAAESLFARALAIEDSKLRANHPYILKTLNCYARMYRESEHPDKALALECRIAASGGG